MVVMSLCFKTMSMSIISLDSKICCWGKVMKWFLCYEPLVIGRIVWATEKLWRAIRTQVSEISTLMCSPVSSAKQFLPVSAQLLICSSGVLCEPVDLTYNFPYFSLLKLRLWINCMVCTQSKYRQSLITL